MQLKAQINIQIFAIIIPNIFVFSDKINVIKYYFGIKSYTYLVCNV